MNDAHLYDQAYFQRHYSMDKKREAMYLQELERIYQRKPFGGKVLDVGCGVGNFLELMDDRWEKHGIEPSAYARSQALSKSIYMIDEIQNSMTEYYDLIILRGSFQHIYNPLGTISHAARALKHGGMLVLLATPDADSLVYQIFKTLPALDAPRNWLVIGAKALTNILNRLGFEQVEVLHPYWGTPYASPLKDLANFVLSFFRYRKFAWPGNMMEVYAVKS